MTNKPKDPRGGPNRGQGAKLKYGEPLKRLLVKVPISKEKEIKEKIKAVMKGYEVKK